MSSKGSVLISGASVAGPTVAWWLHKYGFDVTVVERAEDLRKAGQNIDVRGAGREVIKRMGLEQTILDHNTGEKGMSFLYPNAATAVSVPAEANGPTAELEILRGDLSRILHDATKDFTEYMFGDQISGLEGYEDREAVEVTFKSGKTRKFDLVIVAEGVWSKTRKLVFGDEADFKPIGEYIAGLSLDRTKSDSEYAQWYSAPGRRVVFLRPDNHGRTQASLIKYVGVDDAQALQRKDQQAQVDWLRQTFGDLGWETPRVLNALDGADDLWFDFIGMIKAPRWTSGRVAMVGDAAYCATPLSGMGTTLSFIGAYVLAGEIATNWGKTDPNRGEVFGTYQKQVGWIVDKAQNIRPSIIKFALPQTSWGVYLSLTIVKVLLFLYSLAAPIKNKLEWVLAPPADAFKLPDYHIE